MGGLEVFSTVIMAAGVSNKGVGLVLMDGRRGQEAEDGMRHEFTAVISYPDSKSTRWARYLGFSRTSHLSSSSLPLFLHPADFGPSPRDFSRVSFTCHAASGSVGLRRARGHTVSHTTAHARLKLILLAKISCLALAGQRGEGIRHLPCCRDSIRYSSRFTLEEGGQETIRQGNILQERNNELVPIPSR